MTEAVPKFFGHVRCEGREEHHEGFEHFARGALLLCPFAHGDHEGRHRGIVGKHLDVLCHLFDQLVERLEILLRRRRVGHCPIFAAEEEVPSLFEETEAAVDAVAVPGFALADGAEEHFVETQRVGAIFLDDQVGVHHVEHRLRHLLYRPTADVFAVFEHKFSIGIFRSPSLEGFGVEHVGRNDVHVHVQRRHLVLILQPVAHESVRVLDAINKVRPPLDHSLVHQLAERFILRANAKIEEELVPEARVDQVAGGVFRTAHIEIHLLPVVGRLLAHERRVIVRIHVAEIVGR